MALRNCDRHELSHKVSFRCMTCGTNYRRRDYLAKHIRTQHKSQLDKSVSGTHVLHSISPTGQSGGRIPEDETRQALDRAVVTKTIRPVQNDKYDILSFLVNAKPALTQYIKSRTREHGIKWNIAVNVEFYRENREGEMQTVQPHFRSFTYSLLSENAFNEHDLNQAIHKCMIGFEKYIHEDSGWILKAVLGLTVHTVLYKPLRGSAFIELPLTLKKNGTLLNIRNDDDKCFIYCVLAAVFRCQDTENVNLYQQLEGHLNMKGIKLPVPLSNVEKFERQNDSISINVFGFEEGEIYPLKITKMRERKHHVNLLLLQNQKTSHYCLIKHLDGFLFRYKTNRHHHYFCPFCLNAFTKKALLESHKEYCAVNGEQKIVLPEKGVDDVLKFKDFRSQLLVPFVLYCDFETLNRDIYTCMPSENRPSTTAKKSLEVCSFGYKRVCYDPQYTKPTVIYRGPNACEKFLECLLEEEKEIFEILSRTEPMRLTPDNEKDFLSAPNCSICGEKFHEESFDIVHDHDHLTGLYRGKAHNQCNLLYQSPKFICVIFHGLRNFDGHIICQCIGKFEQYGGIKCIPQNLERYISFSIGNFRFLDSYQFLSSSLERLTENLKADGGLLKFHHFSDEFEDVRTAKLLLRKNVYPYDYMNDERRFAETQLPSKDDFYSSIKCANISDEDYAHSLNVFSTLNLETLGDYSDLYLKTDVLLLADIFENFRKVSHQDYHLDPCHFYSAPGLSWAAMLRMTKVELELLSDIDNVLLFERGIRGGISQISKRYSTANNTYLQNYNANEPTSYIQYLDANNLYGWACQQYLPIRNFRQLSDKEIQEFDIAKIADNSAKGYLIETSLEYPSHLHDEHNCLPLAPVKRHIESSELSPYAQQLWSDLHGKCKRAKSEKLLTTLEDKDHYVVHYRNLKLYLQLGLRIKQIHNVLEFDQEPWLKPYIDFNTQKRKEAKTEFEKSFYKLLNCSVFGKLLECQRKQRSVFLTNSPSKLAKMTAKPLFQECRIFNEHLVGVHCKKSKVTINRPIYAGQVVLDLSKCLMYDFFYNYLKRKYQRHCQLLMTDTDSLLFRVQTNNIYEDFKEDEEYFDFSDYCTDHFLYSERNKKVPGKFKDELNGRLISKFCGLRSKMYAFTFDDKEKKTAKGISKSTIETQLHFNMYEETLLNRSDKISTMDIIRSRKHNIFCETIRKTSLSSFDDKRYLLNDGISSLAYGHYYINENQNGLLN